MKQSESFMRKGYFLHFLILFFNKVNRKNVPFWLPMTGFKPEPSSVGSNHSANFSQPISDDVYLCSFGHYLVANFDSHYFSFKLH